MTEEYEDTDELELEDEEQPGGNEMYEHYRIEADRGQIPLRKSRQAQLQSKAR